MTTNEIAIIEASQFPALVSDGDTDLAEVIAENLGGDGLQPRDLDRVPIPGGGGTTWEIESLVGTESFRELEGIIIAQQTARKFWSQSLDESDETTPPDCASDEGHVGSGIFGVGSSLHPSGDCATCPMNQWGSGSDDPSSDKGPKACREGKLLYLLRPGDIIPSTLLLPPTSLNDYRDYMKALTKSRLFFHSVVTKFSLEKAESGGKRWSIVKPSLGGVLDPETAATARALGVTLKTAYNARMAELRANPIDTTEAETPVADPKATEKTEKPKPAAKS
jgi:hypothetical protein